MSRRKEATLARLGEWGWLDRLLPQISKGLPWRVALGPGDDAALIRAGKETWAITTDMLVEGVHFHTDWSGPEALGHKTLAVNLSDLAAMGDVEPTVGVLSAGLPPGTPVRFVEGFHRGLQHLARRHGFFLVGGDTVRSEKLVFSLTALGRVRGPVFRRTGARPGDVLMVTGFLGEAAAALESLGPGRKKSSPSLLRRLFQPEPRLAWARVLARTGAVTAALDCSDGFWRSLQILARASGVGARVRAEGLPVSPALKRWAGPRAVDFALAGGEDYELVFTVRPGQVNRVEGFGWARAVGEIIPARAGLTVFQNGVVREEPLASNILTVKKVPDISRETENEAETLALARRVGALLKPGDWVGLIGELGSGKTVFVKGLSDALHVAEGISSPTFSIVKTYRAKKGGIPLRHVDLYRLAMAEVPALEWEELHDDHGVTVVEWAEKAQYLWPTQCLPVRIEHQGQDARRINFYVYGARSEQILRRLKGTP